MAGCILFASGNDFDVDAFLETSPWRVQASASSGLQIEISDENADVAAQIGAATAFLETHDAELQRLKTFAGVEDIELRFGGWWHEDTAAFVLSLPPELAELAGKHGVEISVCVYAAPESKGAE